MLTHGKGFEKYSLEAVGVAKLLKLTMKLRQFYDSLKAAGHKEYTIKEQFDFIRDILDA